MKRLTVGDIAFVVIVAIAELLILIAPKACGQVSFSGAKLSGFSVGPPPSGATDYTNNLANWWKMSENTGTLTLDSITGSNATLTGSAAWITQSGGPAINFVDTNSYLQMGTNTAGVPLTVVMWLNCTNPTALNWLLYDSDNDGTTGYFFYLQSDGIQFKATAASGSDLQRGWAVSSTFDSKWGQLALVWTNGIASTNYVNLYTNGVFCSAWFGTAVNGGTGGGTKNTTTSRWIGRSNSTGVNYYSGFMKGVRVYKEAVSDANILAIYNATLATTGP